VAVPVEVPGRDRVILAQVALARRGISSGSVDGVVGSQTRAALRVFQREAGLRVTGELDAATWAALGGEVGGRMGKVATSYTVTAKDVERLKPVPGTWLGKSQQDRLDYETVVELVAEKFHAHPRLVRAWNPGVDWGRVRPGTELRVPEVGVPAVSGRVAYVRIRLRDKTLQAFDERSRRVLHFPCSIARRVEKRPLGTLRVVHVAPNPNYRFDPAIFRDSEEARRIGRRLMIPPGPNNPVGTAWIGLDRPGYGIHGTPHPEDVGRTESSGCFRLANWNAELLLPLVWVGMPVYVEP
jgi:lipoprotein-anchoring transpeptidase ErfK/SrfK